MLRACPGMRRCLWIAVPLVAAHLGCLALPAVTVAVAGTAIALPICGQPPGALQRLGQWVVGLR